MKKYIQIIFACVFLLFLIVPIGAMAITGESTPVANEIQSPRPHIITDGKTNTEYLSQLTDYLADRFAFRREMITLWAEINSKLFKTSTEKQVVLGSNGWLYYSDTLDDFQGISFDGKQLDIIAGNLALMQEFVEGQGGTFVFTVAPNKNSLYPQYMPVRIKNRHDNSNLAQLSGRLNSELNYADLYGMFSNNPDVCYYLTDTHWTQYGAALGADLILSKAGKTSDFGNASFSTIGAHTGDLYEMLYPALKDNEVQQLCNGVGNYTLLNDDKDGNALKFNAENILEDGRLFCWRDSFGISLYPYLAEKYAQSQFMRSTSYNLFTCGSFENTTVIIELVERNLGYLITNTPRFAAPERVVLKGEDTSESVNCSVGGTESYNGVNYRLISAQISSDSCESDNRVYFFCGDTAYEAYLVYNSESNTYTAAAWLEEDITPDSVTYMSEENYISFRAYF